MWVGRGGGRVDGWVHWYVGGREEGCRVVRYIRIMDGLKGWENMGDWDGWG